METLHQGKHVKPVLKGIIKTKKGNKTVKPVQRARFKTPRDRPIVEPASVGCILTDGPRSFSAAIALWVRPTFKVLTFGDLMQMESQ